MDTDIIKLTAQFVARNGAKPSKAQRSSALPGSVVRSEVPHRLDAA